MKTKDSRPRKKLSGNSHFLIEFAFEFSHLKNLYRQGWLKKNIPEEKCESVADHSFGVAILSMIVAEEYFPDLDIANVMKIALTHEIGEIIVGDITPHDKISKEEKHKLEETAVKEIFEGFPNPEKYISIWKEYENNRTPEAKFVKQMDRLEMALQASVYEHQEHGNLSEFYESVKDAINEPKIKEILDKIISLKE